MLASEMLAAPVLKGIEGVAEAVEVADVELAERTGVLADALETNPLLEGTVTLLGMTWELTVVDAASLADVTVLTRTSVLVTVLVNVEVEVAEVSAATSWVAARQRTDEARAPNFIFAAKMER